TPSAYMQRSLGASGRHDLLTEFGQYEIHAGLLETRQFRKADVSAMDVHFPVLGAARQRGYDLLGIEQTIRIECSFERQKIVEFLARELNAHLIDFFHAHPMLAGDRTPDLHAELEDSGAEFLGALDLVGRVGIEEDERMQIAVARMEDIGTAQTELVLHLLYRTQDAAEMAARNGPVHAVVVRRDAAGRRECVLAPRPEDQALRFRSGDLQAYGAGALEHRLHARDFVLDLFFRAIRF